jgi:ribosomal protein S18 acetylase RimI-like enzyme
MEIRRGSVGDVAAMVGVMFVEPSREAIALAGSVDRAYRFQLAFLEMALRSAGNAVFVAEDHHDVLGFAFVSDGSDVPPFRRLTAMSVAALGVVGALAAAWRSSARIRVNLRPPGGGLHLVELHVHPDRRSSGIGDRLLAAADEYARGQGGVSLVFSGSIVSTATIPDGAAGSSPE